MNREIKYRGCIVSQALVIVQTGKEKLEVDLYGTSYKR